MDIRTTQQQDFAAIAGLTNEFIRNTAVHFAYEPMSPDDLAAQWQASGGKYPWLTAEVDGRFAGYAKSGPWRTRSAYQWTAELGGYLESPFRGRGLGKALYARVIDVLRDGGFHSVIGGVALPNPASVRLHESLGFTFVRAFREVGYKLGAWHDVAFWQLSLSPRVAAATSGHGADEFSPGSS